MIQGPTDPANPPFLSARLPRFLVAKGGNYFALPNLTVEGLIANGAVSPR